MEKEFINIFDRPMTIISSVMLTADEQNGNNIKTTTIGDFVNPQQQYQYVDKIESIRALCPNLEEKLRNKLVVDAKKKALPAGIISGVAVDGISGTNIVERNGVIPFDIDAQDNPALYDWEAVKAAVSKSPYVAYAGLSVTGLGVWGMIPVEDATKHKEHFEAISRDFANNIFTIMQDQDTEPTILHGIHLDQAPSNIASKRFVSYDPKPYWNTAAQVYTKIIEPVKLYERKYVTFYQGGFNIMEFFKKHNISYNVRERQGGIQYAVTCPWAHLHSSSSKNDSAVFVYPNGALGFKCMHAHCADKHWHQYREFYEPDAYNKSIDW
jgi:hypothetical protein